MFVKTYSQIKKLSPQTLKPGYGPAQGRLQVNSITRAHDVFHHVWTEPFEACVT